MGQIVCTTCGNPLNCGQLTKLLKKGSVKCGCGTTVKRQNGIRLFIEPKKIRVIRELSKAV